jgi:alpha-1,6-mannosyltransferase
VAPSDRYDGEPVAQESGLAFTLRYAIPGLVGMAVVAVGAFGVGWIPLDSSLQDIPLIHTLRVTDVGKFVSRASVILGGALFLQAWLVVGADVLAGHVRDIRRLWAVLALWCAPLLLAPPLFSRDVYSYFVQGKLVLGGGDPYSAGVASIPGWFRDGVDPMWQFTPTPYGPMFLSLSRGVAAFVGDNPYLAVIVFRLIALCGVALLAYYVPRLAFHCGIDASKALWLGVMNPLVLMHFVAGAHNDSLMIGLVVAGLAIAIEGRPMVGVVILSLGGMVKPIGLLALPFIGLVWAGTRADLRGRIVAWVKTAATFALSYVVLAGLVGTSLGWIRALTTPGEVRTWLSPATALGMASGNLLSWIGLGDHLDTTVGFFRLIGEVLAVAIVAWLCLKPQGRTAVRSLALAFIAVVALGPVVQPWYLLWALPLAAASGLSPRELRVVVLLTAAFTLYGLCETSATGDSLLELSDGLAMLASAAAIGLAVTISPRERALVFGGEVAHGLMPDDKPAAARRERLVVRDPSTA